MPLCPFRKSRTKYKYPEKEWDEEDYLETPVEVVDEEFNECYGNECALYKSVTYGNGNTGGWCRFADISDFIV